MSLSKHPNFSKIVDLVTSQNPLQRRKITSFIERQDQIYWEFCENLSATLNNGLLCTQENRLEAAKAYNKMCMDFLKEQIKFKKSGEYSVSDSKVAQTEVYDDFSVMRYYMLGLLISYMLWPNHYKLYRFLVDNLPENNCDNFLEVGVGHGLFASTITSLIPSINGTGIDISETSIKIAKSTLDSFKTDKKRFEFIHGDYLETDFEGKKFDFIVMGEVLEHVNNASEFMAKTKTLLSERGQVYLTTCANCPALDHVYHFKRVDEIRTMMTQNGFQIVSESALPADDVPESKWEEELTTINYCCILRHK